jgi:hypothetical protein
MVLPPGLARVIIRSTSLRHSCARAATSAIVRRDTALLGAAGRTLVKRSVHSILVSRPRLEPAVRQVPYTGTCMRIGDIPDLIVERYAITTLFLVGVLSLGVAEAGYYRYLPPPWSAPVFPPRCLGCQQLTALASVFQLLGVLSIGLGFRLVVPRLLARRRDRLRESR